MGDDDTDSIISISTTDEENEDCIDDDDWNDEEVLKRVLEISKLEAAGADDCQSERDDLRQALELSLKCEPLVHLSDHFNSSSTTSDPGPSSKSRTDTSATVNSSNDQHTRQEEFTKSQQQAKDEIGDVFKDLATFENEIIISDDDVDSDWEAQSVIIEKERTVDREDTIIVSDDDDPEPAAEQDKPDEGRVEEQQLSHEEVSWRIRNIFQSSISSRLDEAEACDAILTQLFSHQKSGLGWMMKQEGRDDDGMRGGILADEMGLGKSLTVVALILTNHWGGRPLSSSARHRKTRKRHRESVKGDLDQKVWSKRMKKMKKKGFVTNISSSSEEDEFDLMTRNNTTLLDKLNNTSQEVSATEELSSKDEEPEVILHCHNSEDKQQSKQDLSNVIFYSDSEEEHDDPVDTDPDDPVDNEIKEEHDDPEQKRRGSTLIVCPTSLISHWVEQFQTHVNKNKISLRVKVHHGSSRAVASVELETSDVVITSYGTLSSEIDTGDTSPLIRTPWLRVVLDEGHYIKNQHSKCWRSVMQLDSERKWIITGTPIMNNLMELWSLVNWLGFTLYTGSGGEKLFKQHIETPCKQASPSGYQRLQVLVEAVCLRRTKHDTTQSGDPIVDLPHKSVFTHQVLMSGEERQRYDKVHSKAKDIVHQFQRQGDLLSHYAHVFALITRLRQLCCHHQLVPNLGDLPSDNPAPPLDQNDNSECCVCLSASSHLLLAPCSHIFCQQCLPTSCPLCQAPLVTSQLVVVKNKQTRHLLPQNHDCSASSKIVSVLEVVKRIVEDDPEDKIVIVSQFTSFLDLIQPRLTNLKLSFTRLDGRIPHLRRADIIRRYQRAEARSPKILLLSLKAGGVGLNLTAANHLLLLDPAWNPATEDQCSDRVHRLGQTKPVHIHKFITKDSIEEKMIEIQTVKKNLISGAFHQHPEECRKQRIEEISKIFGL